MSAAVDAGRAARAARVLAVAGAWGAGLTVVIVAASALVRLATRIEAGEAISMLPPAVESAVRLLHRLSAMGVSLLALLALATSLVAARAAPARVLAACAAVALVAVLAILGRQSPGYRDAAVTAANVACGTLLAALFAWLHAQSRVAPRRAWPARLPLAAIAVLLAASATGAASHALALHGARGLESAHLWLGHLFLALAVAAAWVHRDRRARALGVALVSVAQAILGFLMLVPGAAPGVAAGLHAVASVGLALLLVSLAMPRAR